MLRWIKHHSLSLVLLVGGLLLCAASIPLREGTWFDLVSQTGGGLMVAGLVNILAGPLQETNKPEKPPGSKRPRKRP